MTVRQLALLLFSGALAAATVLAQTPPKDEAQPDDSSIIKVQVQNVLVPVTVLDRNGGIVDALEPGRFHLYDNNKQQDIRVDVAVHPLSIVIAVQQSDRVEAILTQIHKIGPMIQPLVTGENGEAAIISFDSRVQDKQGFTNDPDLLTKAIANIHAGNSAARLYDAIEHGVRMLSQRPATQRRVILLISEARDVSSEARLRETLISAQLANVSIYAVDISRFITSLTAKAQPGRPDPLPPSAYNLPGGVPSTPTTIAQATGFGGTVEIVPLLKEVYTGTKRIFFDNPVKVFAQGTGGEQYAFARQHGLEDAIQDLAREVHNQYLVTYNPNNKDEGGFHQIRVEVDVPNLIIHTRPGYYLAGLGK